MVRQDVALLVLLEPGQNDGVTESHFLLEEQFLCLLDQLIQFQLLVLRCGKTYVPMEPSAWIFRMTGATERNIRTDHVQA